MDDQLLSDDEIRELIRSQNDATLTREEIDALGEIGNISIGTSATTLYSLLRNKVVITTPHVSITSMKKLKEMYPMPFIAVEVDYTKGLHGSNLMIIKEEDAKIIADLMMGGDGRNTDFQLDDLRLSAVGEAMNQMMGSAATSLSTVLKKDINISPPKVIKINFASDSLKGYFEENEEIVNISFRMEVGDFLKSEIMQLMPIGFAKTLVEYVYNQYGDTKSVEEPAMPAQSVAAEPKQAPAPQGLEQKTGSHEKGKVVTVTPVQFENFEPEQTIPHNASLDLIMDVPLEVTVELGRTIKTIKDILEFGPGTIVELNKMAGEPVDILINGKFIAKGEVVVIDENFGVRITEIVNSMEKVNSLQ
jgi:flagellar motor switch protein FliN/FliY